MSSDPPSLYLPLDPPIDPPHNTSGYPPCDTASYPIRLLRIQSGQEHEPIVCRFFQTYLGDSAPTYKALSYRWSNFAEGMPYRQPPLLIDDHDSSAFQVGDNLYEAIRQIRHAHRGQDVLLWADALCIDQNNGEEKGQQVQQMGRVYEGAEEVLIWLGSSTPDVESLFDLVTWIDRNATDAQAGITRDGDWKSLCALFMDKMPLTYGMEAVNRGLTDILSREWWNRVWILQEVAMARTAKIMCGSATCPARTFALLPSLIGIEVSAHTRAALDIMPRLRKGTWWTARRDLHFLLTKFAESEAGWPRDKVYALLGMSEDACNAQRFPPCYLKSDRQVFRDTVSFLLFGEIADTTYAFPEFGLPDLHMPLIQLTEKTLEWTLGQGEESLREPSRNTAESLVRRINERSLKVGDLLLSLAIKYAREAEIREISSSGRSITAVIEFGDAEDSLTFNSEDGSLTPITFSFPRRQSTKRADLKRFQPKAPIDEHGDIPRQIDDLIEAGSSSEEIMRAYVWARDRDAVKRLIEEGADINGADQNGDTALHMAAWLGDLDMVKLLGGNDAIDLKRKNNHGATVLHLAIAGSAQVVEQPSPSNKLAVTFSGSLDYS